VQLPPFSYHFIPLRSKYSSQNPVLKHPRSICGWQTFWKKVLWTAGAWCWQLTPI
jgi:hypothetical protein